MKRNTIIILITAFILIAVNLIPFRTGPTVGIYCGMEYHKQTLAILGQPYGYLQTSTHTGCGATLVKLGTNVFKVNNRNNLGYDKYYFKASAFIADAAVGIVLLTGVYLISRRY